MAHSPLDRKCPIASPPFTRVLPRPRMARQPRRRCGIPSSLPWLARRTRCTAGTNAIRNSAKRLRLRGERDDIYPVAIQIIEGNGHTGLPDRDKIADMYPAVRNPVPRELTWLMTD